MKGHRRRDRTFICPDALPSPPVSPTRSSRALPGGPFRAAVFPEIVIPDNVRFHHRPNPNWVNPLPEPSSLFNENGSDDSGSVVSTVLHEDGSSVKTSDDDDVATDDENDLMETALGTSIPLASIFNTPKEVIADVQKAARAIGMHAGVMRRPGARTDGKSNVNRFGQRENSWWVVLGRNAEAVRHLVDFQQRGMPGFYQPDKEVETEVTVGRSSSSMGFLQLVLAGAMGGIAVLFGLAKIL